MDSLEQSRIRTSLGALALPILCRHVTGLFVVEEEEIVQALQFAYVRPKLVIDSRVRCVGSVAQAKPQLVGKRVGVVLTGGYVAWVHPWPCLDGAESTQR